MSYSNTGQYTPATGATTATPGATIASATWNGIHSDLATALSYNMGSIVAVARGVTFSVANTDFQLQVVLPTNFTRFRPALLEISNPSATLGSSTISLWTGAGATGLQIVTSTATTITTASGNTNNNAQTFTPGQVATIAVSASTVYFRVMNAAGSAASADVVLYLQPVS